VYGEHQNIGDRYRNVIGIFMSQIMREQPLTIFGDGTQTRAFSYIDDVAPYIAKSVTVPAARGEIINVGADAPFTVNELAKVVGRELGVTPKISHLAPRNEVQHAYCDHEKVRRLFGATEPVGLEDGIRRMAKWAKRVGVRESKAFGSIEVLQSLPEAWRR
jgi:UDP-glucose 4-epimerase